MSIEQNGSCFGAAKLRRGHFGERRNGRADFSLYGAGGIGLYAQLFEQQDIATSEGFSIASISQVICTSGRL